MLRKVGHFVGSRALKHNNKRTVAPPGLIRQRIGPLVLVPTMMRTGTHLLIDILINNFSQLKANPLYVDLDVLFEQRNEYNNFDRLMNSGGYVVKTHFPNLGSIKRERMVRSLAERSFVITTDRNPLGAFDSVKRWGVADEGDREIFLERVRQFEQFWSKIPHLTLSFEQLKDQNQTNSIVSEIGSFIGLSPNPNLICPRKPTDRLMIYIDKTLTRLLGAKAPIVNTSIQVASSR